MDAFRQPKTSYYMFMAQRSPEKSDLIADNGPMIYIAHEITPFSPTDVTVYSNCEEIRLTVFKGGKNMSIKKIRIIKVCLLRSSLLRMFIILWNGKQWRVPESRMTPIYWLKV